MYALAVVAERILYFHRIQINTGDFFKGHFKLVNAGVLTIMTSRVEWRTGMR